MYKRQINDTRVRSIQGDIADPAVLEALIGADTAAVFHLAAIVSGQAEACLLYTSRCV